MNATAHFVQVHKLIDRLDSHSSHKINQVHLTVSLEFIVLIVVVLENGRNSVSLHCLPISNSLSVRLFGIFYHLTEFSLIMRRLGSDLDGF